jgi:WD40 repeat protein
MCLAITHNNITLFSGSKDKSAKAMSLESYEAHGSVASHQGAVTCIVVNSNDTIFATGNFKEMLHPLKQAE